MKNRVIYLSEIRKNLKKLSITHVEYNQNILAVASCQAEILNTPLPSDLYYQPESYGRYIKLRAEANDLLNIWNTNITAQLGDVPNYINTNLNSLNTDLNTAINCAKKLAKGWNESDANMLRTCLGNSAIYIRSSSSHVTLLLDTMKKFKTESLITICSDLNTLTDSLLAESDTDTKKIADLQKELEELKSNITNYAIAIAGGIAAMGIGIVMGGMCIASLGFNPGAIVGLFVMIPIMVAGGYVVIKNSISLAASVKSFNVKTESLKLYEADALQLSNASSDYDKIGKNAEKLEDNVSVVIVAWENIADSLDTIAASIDNSENEMNESDWNELISLLEETQVECEQLKNDLIPLDISDLKGTTTTTNWEMSEEEVKEVMANAKIYPIDEYIMAI